MCDPTRRRSTSYAIVSAVVYRALSRAFPGSRFVPIGSHSRSTAIAVHSHVDFLAVLPTAWAKWGGRRVSPATIIDRMIENMQSLPSALSPAVRCDGSGVELYFKGTIFALDVIPGFMVRTADQYPVYSMPGQVRSVDRDESGAAQRTVRPFERPVQCEITRALSVNQSVAICPLPAPRNLELICGYDACLIGHRRGS